MPRYMPGWKCAVVVKAALALLSSVVLAPQDARSAESALNWVSPSRVSTLDAYVPPQTSRLDAALIDSINHGLKTNRPAATKSKVKNPISSKPESNRKTVGAPRTARSTEAVPSIDIDSAKAKTASPLSRWLTPDDITLDRTENVRRDGALATDKSPVSARKDTSDKSLAPSNKIPEQVNSTISKREPSERIAFRFRRREEQQPQKFVPQATMHPTEKQKDDRRRPSEQPAENIPKPERTESENSSRDSADKLPPLQKWQIQLRTKVRRVLAHHYSRPLSTHDRSPWEVMHSLLAFEVDSKVARGGPRGKPITAVGWLCFNQPCKRRTLMYVNDEGELRVRVGPALQGHRGQLMAMLAQSKVSQDYPMLVEGHELTVADLIEMEKRTCFPRSELTFKLIGLMHYLPSDSQWVNEQGMEWDLRKLVSEELRQPVRGAACGGTHRLAGLTLAYKKREQRGEPVDGEYLRAKRFVTKYQQYAYRMQNPDGSFSTEWFRGPGNEDSIDRKLKTTGHLLEWLLYTATEKELKYSRTTRAANYLANIMYNNRNKDWEAGPLGHAIHALVLYDRLVFSPYDKQSEAPVASRPQRPNSLRSRR
jgi:hypothetical protein